MISLTEKEKYYLGIGYYFQQMEKNIEWFKKMNNEGHISFLEEAEYIDNEN